MFLPWPMKAKGLVKLEVRGCTLEGFTSEFNKSSKLVDELQDLTLDRHTYLFEVCLYIT
jgi:hypothetical protein